MLPIESFIDYTLLKQGCTEAQIIELCQTADKHQFAAVCVPPCYVDEARKQLKDSKVKICSVIGFPHGMNLLASKLTESHRLIALGADELDMVINLSALRNGDTPYLTHEIKYFIELCREKGVVSKLILESGLLTMEELDFICEICIMEKPDFVKTSTGFAGVGAELDKVKRMRELLPSEIQIKASGGIRDKERALEFIHAGASRIGTSSAITSS